MIIRDAVKKDLGRISELSFELAKYENKFNPLINVSEKRLTATKKWYKEKFGKIKIVVAEDEGRIVGYATAFMKKKESSWFTQDTGYLCDIFILPEYRKKGLSKKMGEECIKYLEEKGAKVITLDVYSGNPAAKKWKKAGFTEYTIGMRREKK